MKNKKIIKRILSGSLSALMITSFIQAIPATSVSAAQVYTYDGYEVTTEWDGDKNVSVTVTNTGDDSIYNWALMYDAGSEVTNLYNAVVYDSKDTAYVIKNNNCNYEIKPKQSVSFGYQILSDTYVEPTGFELCSNSINIEDGDGYEV